MNLVDIYVSRTCNYCGGQGQKLIRRRMNTAYVDEEANYMESCEDCFNEMEAYWAERWADYNAERI